MTEPAKPRVWTIFVAYFTAFGLIAIGGGAVVGFGIGIALARGDAVFGTTLEQLATDPKAFERFIESASSETWFVVASAAISAFTLAVVAVGAAKMSPTALVERLRLGPARGGARRFAVAPLASVAALAAGGTIGGVLELVFGKRSNALTGIEKAMQSTGLMLVLTFFVIAVTTPIGEELFFRGYAQTRFVARYGRFRGILAATGLFAVLHLDPMHVAVAFAIGVVLAWTTERTGSIRAAIFAHAANNGLFVIAAQRPAQPPTTWQTVWVLAVVAVVAVAGIALLTGAPGPAASNAES